MHESLALEILRPGLQEIHRDLAAELAKRSPVCSISGRCCRFKEYDHTLFLSSVEAELLLKDGPPPARPLDDGDTCPWQDLAGRCTAREARPLGCRLYFCDPAFQEEMPELSERFIGRLKRLISEHGLPWNYAPLHRHLHQILASGDPRLKRDEI